MFVVANRELADISLNFEIFEKVMEKVREIHNYIVILERQTTCASIESKKRSYRPAEQDSRMTLAYLRLYDMTNFVKAYLIY